MIHRPPATAGTRLGLLRRATATGRLLAVRSSFALLDLLAPDVAAKRAMGLWVRLPGNPGRRKDFRPRPGALSRVHAPTAGADVVVETWGEEGAPVVYLVHGWGGWRGQMGAFVDPLLTRGYRVVAFDSPSHGDAPPGAFGPGKGALTEVAEAFAVVAAEHGPAAGVIAHSMGCTTASMVLRDGLDARALVLVAPNADVLDITHQFARMLGFGERTRTRLVGLLEDFTQCPMGDFDLGPMGAAGAMPPTLVVHDRHDKETAFAVGEAVAAAWPTAELVATEGLGHQRILADGGVVERSVEFLVGARAVTPGS